MSQDQHLEIMSAVARIETRIAVVETKTDELVRRVGIQNGRVADSEIKIAKIKESMAGDAGEKKGISVSWARFLTVVGLVSTILGIILSIAYIYTQTHGR
jgi:hypothetical protein